MRKIKWGVLGTAFIADWCTIPGMVQAENCELYAIAGRNPEKLNAFKEKYGFRKAYEGYDALLADPEVEAVYIPLPNEMHMEWTIKALQAKKHVLCEKPLAPSYEQVEAMIRAADENGVLLMEAFAYLHSPFVQAVKAELDAGKIGDVRYMETAFLTSDYDVSNIRMRRETFGGSLYDLGCYNTSQILWMLGEEPEKVQAIAEFSDRNVDMVTCGLLKFADGKKAAFTCGMLLATEKDKRIDRLQIHGTDGWIKSETRFNQDGELSYTICTNDVVTTKTVTAPQNYRLEVEQFGRCILDGEKPHVSNDFTRANSRLLDRLLKEINY